MDLSRRPLDSFGIDLLIAQPDVVFDRAAKKKYVLQDDGKIRAQIVQVPIPYIDAVKKYLTLLHIVKTHQQIGYGGFPRTGMADERQALTDIRGKGNVL